MGTTCQGFSDFSVILHHFVLAKLANSSMRFKGNKQLTYQYSHRQKQPGNFEEILKAKASLGKYLREKCYAEHYQQLYQQIRTSIIKSTVN